MADWWIGQLTDWRIVGGLADWRINGLVDWPIDGLFGRTNEGNTYSEKPTDQGKWRKQNRLQGDLLGERHPGNS